MRKRTIEDQRRKETMERLNAQKNNGGSNARKKQWDDQRRKRTMGESRAKRNNRGIKGVNKTMGGFEIMEDQMRKRNNGMIKCAKDSRQWEIKCAKRIKVVLH